MNIRSFLAAAATGVAFLAAAVPAAAVPAAGRGSADRTTATATAATEAATAAATRNRDEALISRLPYRFRRLAKARPDECFAGVGLAYPAGPPCRGGRPKVNQAYVWGLTQAGRTIWFGTGANVHCLVSGATLDYVVPTANDNWTCEYGNSQTALADGAIPPYLGDMRAPQVWTYDTVTGRSVDMSARIRARGAVDAARLAHTVGLRAAGTFGGVVLLGGPALENTLNMFAFDATTKAYLGSINFADYGNIRTFLVADDALYLGVGIGRNGSAGGAVWRWTGSRTDPFAFQTVADLPVQAADLTEYDGRLAATSWPAEKPTTQQMLAGLWISPRLADGEPGLTPDDAAGWTQVWNARQYETDRVVSATYGGGGIAAFDGYVYWGTMHVPMKSSTVHATVYPPADDATAKEQAVKTQRAISIWRGKDLGGPTQKIELLYGESTLPAWDPATAEWRDVPTGWTPKYGKSGFGYLFNNYTWRMTVTDGKLFVGTMDWSYLVKDLLASAATGAPVNARARRALADPGNWHQPYINPATFGGDLWMFPSAGQAAQPINVRGEGNYLNYGIRNMIPNGGGGLYLGMANPMNLRTDRRDLRPEGGWELLEMTGR
ncbi:hypothetical protein [Mangrovihabitans endophyticus]|uniref:DUF4185 domain-containing protein n=1 Tax=Mangrovihabitans endophyticus TaxID=1751298 RepID=A0A8J3BYQ9_9ACTN|nr:hypothetical protein [Mangrovihabitans endophyticus]GGK83925.1 hypothetical protein GCM10012284_17590 [Mangrovihabitans endophyticus]